MSTTDTTTTDTTVKVKKEPKRPRTDLKISDQTKAALKDLQAWPDEATFNTKQAMYLLGCDKAENQNIVTKLIRTGALVDALPAREYGSDHVFTARALRMVRPQVTEELKRRFIASQNAARAKEEAELALKQKVSANIVAGGGSTVSASATAADPTNKALGSFADQMRALSSQLKDVEEKLKNSDVHTLSERLDEVESRISLVQKVFDDSKTDTIPQLNERLSRIKEQINTLAKDLLAKANLMGDLTAQVEYVAKVQADNYNANQVLQKQFDFLYRHFGIAVPSSIERLSTSAPSPYASSRR